MDKHDFRAIILKLEDRLSENDRTRLHFFLRDDAPQRYIDDLSIGGTLNLIDSLIDQDLINENNFNFLIDAFYTIQCFDAVKLLKEYKNRMQPNMMGQSFQSLSSIMPPMNNQFRLNQSEGIGSSDSLPTDPINMSNCTDDVFNNNYTKVNRTILSSPRQRNSLFMAYKCFPGIIVLLIIAAGILSGFTVAYKNRIQRLTDEVGKKDNDMLQLQKKTNVTRQLNEKLKNRASVHDLRVFALTSKQSEYENDIKTLNNQLAELQENQKTFPIMVGHKFGGPDGIYFCDSSPPNFTYYHYLNGMTISHDERNNKLESIQFHYRSSYDQQSNIKSEIHGNYGFKSENTQTLILNNDERIYKVRGQITNLLELTKDNSKYRKTLIRGIQFFTTKGREFPSYKDEDDDETFFEQYNGYILGYVTGRTNRNIDQLQFYWYRIEAKK